MPSSAPVRGCGVRIKGSLYLETHLAPGGTPVEDFILDPPVPVDIKAAGITAIGQKLLRDPNGVYHVVDWIGATHYPNVEDYIRECVRHGISRRVAKTLNLALLTPASRLLLIHPRAIIRNHSDYWSVIKQRGTRFRCLARERETGDHPASDAMCSGLWEYDVEGGSALNHWEQSRAIGDTVYACPERVGLSTVDTALALVSYAPGFFASFPIGNLAIITDPADPAKTEAVYAKLRDTLKIDITQEDA